MNRKETLIAYIGRNGSGKTYTLNKILESSPQNTLYISEEGIARVIHQKNRVSIDMESGKYLYYNELERGKIRETEEYTINDKSKSIIEYCQNIISRTEDIQSKSQGQKKLENMMNIFLDYNLNNIENILFDEPENFFDEEYLKLISEFIELLTQQSYNIKIATHNSRLLSIIEIDIENIILMNNCKNKKFEQKSISKDEIKEMFAEISSKVDLLKKEYKCDKDAGINYKLNIHTIEMAFNSYISRYVNNIDFYSALFFKTIIIVEGLSDFEAMKSINHKLDTNVYVFSANGKAWIPFYTTLFLKLGKTVITMIDTDSTKKSHATILTNILEEMEVKNENMRLIQNDPDIEGEYNIDIDKIGKDVFLMSKKIRGNNKGWLKQLSAYYFFREKEHWTNLEEKIFPKGIDCLEDEELFSNYILRQSIQAPDYNKLLITLKAAIREEYKLEIVTTKNGVDGESSFFRIRNFIIDDSNRDEKILYNIYLRLEPFDAKRIEKLNLIDIDINNVREYESTITKRSCQYYICTANEEYGFTFSF